MGDVGAAMVQSWVATKLDLRLLLGFLNYFHLKMPQPVSRLFPKLFVKSDDAQLVLTTNAIAILNTADGVSQLPTRRAPKQLAIVLDHSIRLVLHVNGVNVAPKLLSKHLQVALVSVRTLTL